MAVGAQNDLGGQQTFARKMTWCVAFLCQNWDGFFCPNWGVLQNKNKKKVCTETETVFWQWCAQISRLFAQINRPFARIFDDFRRFEPNGGATAPLPPPPPPLPTAMLTTTTGAARNKKGEGQNFLLWLKHMQIEKLLFRQIVSNYCTKVKRWQVEVLRSFMQQTHKKITKRKKIRIKVVLRFHFIKRCNSGYKKARFFT